jgi:hypothetical protein
VQVALSLSRFDSDAHAARMSLYTAVTFVVRARWWWRWWRWWRRKSHGNGVWQVTLVQLLVTLRQMESTDTQSVHRELVVTR